MKVIEATEVREQLTMSRCIELMREAFCRLEKGEALQPIRSMVHWPGGEVFGFMPAYLGADSFFGAKVVNAFPQNVGTEYPSHNGYVMVFESRHGTCIGLADAGTITEIRTGAVSGVATDLLAKRDAKSLAIIGAGAQGKSHLEAMLCVRPGIHQVKVYDIRREAAENYQQEMEARFGIPVIVEDSAEAAVIGADIICTVTSSKDPYLQEEWVSPGAHINAVGTFSPITREVSSRLMAKSRLYADQIEACRKESGEYLIPLNEGLILENHIQGSIGQLLMGQAEGRRNDQEITLFDALGLAVEDVICGMALCTEQDVHRS